MKYSQLVSEEIYQMFSQPKYKIYKLVPSFVTRDLLNNCRNKTQHAFQMGNGSQDFVELVKLKFDKSGQKCMS